MAPANEAEPVRGLGNFTPSLWGDRFISFSLDKTVIEAHDDQINLLKEEVRRMLMDHSIAVVEKVNLINDVHRLGLSYHFEEEIDSQLETIFTKINPENVKDYDLYTTSIQFRIFREFGYKMPCDVFEKFVGNNGKFMENLASDVRGMLSLYEASQLRIRGEDILDEAAAFSTAHLQKLPCNLIMSPLLKKQVAQALRRPFRKGMPRLEAAYYISFYEEEETTTRDELLLKFAKLDFNKLQSLYQYELSVVSKWWKDGEFTRRVPHARDRVVESYFWVNGVHFEPRYSAGRIANAKLVQLLTIIDDTFDAYGTIEELKLFADAFSRWDESAMDLLPVDSADRWRFMYKTMRDFCNELDELATSEVRNCSVYNAKEGVQELVREYYQEAFWSANRISPTYDEYMVNSLITSGIYMLALNMFKGMGESATKHVYDWLHTRPRICKASEAVVRLQDDIVTHEAEQARGQFGSAVEYYTKQYGVSKEEAIEEIQKQLENAWKDMNEGFLKPIAVPKDFLFIIFRLATSVDVIYKYSDGFTKAKDIEGYISLLFLSPMIS